MITVLFVDDEPALLDIARFFLEKRGDIEVSTSVSAAGALNALNERKFDVIVSDYEMPGMNGIDLLKQLGDHARGIPFIVFTGQSREEVAIEALNQGAKFYLQKGGDPKSQFAELENMIRHLVKLARAEDAVRKSEEKFHDLLDNANDLIQSVSPEGQFVYVNKTWLSTLGYDRSSLPGLSLSRLIKPENQKHFQTIFRRVLSGEDVGVIITSFVKSDGREVKVEGKMNCRFADGRPLYTRGVFRDVTEQDRTAEALRQSEDQFKGLYSMMRLMCDNVPDLIWAKDKEKRYIFANKAVCETILSASDTNEPIGKTDMFFAAREHEKHPDEPEWHTFGEICSDSDNVALNTKKAERFIEFGNVKGKFLYLDVYKAPFLDESGTIIGTVGCARDITKEHAVEKALHESEALFHSLVDNMLNPTFILDWDGTILFRNKAAAQFAGLISQDECINQRVLDFVHPDYVTLIKNDLSLMKDDKGGFLSEYLVKNSSGEQRWVEGLGTKIDFMERSAVILTLRDVTDRKFAREALIQVNKNNNKMNLLNSITRHDLLNQLSVLQGCLELAMNHETNPVTREYLKRGNNACETIRRQIDFSRDYQNIGVLSPQWQNVHEVIGHAAESCDLGTVTLVINSNDVSVYADPLLEKVFYNIIDNSLKHAGAFTEIRFFTEDVNNGLRIVYTDDGIGILDAEKELVFKHRFGRHTGYGLYLAREILSITGLSLKETGISGEGARFEIFVPHGLYRHRDEGEKAPGTYSPEKSDNTPGTQET